jgi:hypothetical protein
MPFVVGDTVYVWKADIRRAGHPARITQVLPKRLSQQDFQEYIVEFPVTPLKGPRFCLYREFELCSQPAESDALNLR